jgi:uncharacterized membrane protein HdeD (DUF308 family)
VNSIRFVTICFFLLSGILHIVSGIRKRSDPKALPMIIFGIIYFATGLLLYYKIQYSIVCGIVFPAIGLASSLMKIGIKNFDAMLVFLCCVDILMIAGCIVLVL